MRDSHGAELTGAAMINKHRSDAAAAIAIFAKAHVAVYFASVPISRDDARRASIGNTALGKMYATLPGLHPFKARFIDAAQAGGAPRPLHRHPPLREGRDVHRPLA